MNAVDTNVLVYARDPRDPLKQGKALALLGTLADPALLWQVACEYLNATRKLEPYGYGRAEAWADVRAMRGAWHTVIPDWAVLDRAEALMGAYSLSYWDALIVAACVEGGVTRLYTEDFGGYPHIEGVEIVNPFV